MEATLTVTLEDVANEATKRLTLPTGRDVDVVIPKGVVDGQVIRLRGLGGPALGVEPGDALLTIKIAPHERFTPEGRTCACGSRWRSKRRYSAPPSGCRR